MASTASGFSCPFLITSAKSLWPVLDRSAHVEVRRRGEVPVPNTQHVAEAMLLFPVNADGQAHVHTLPLFVKTGGSSPVRTSIPARNLPLRACPATTAPHPLMSKWPVTSNSAGASLVMFRIDQAVLP